MLAVGVRPFALEWIGVAETGMHAGPVASVHQPWLPGRVLTVVLWELTTWHALAMQGRLHGNALPPRDAHHHASANSRAAERLQRYLQLEPTSTRSSTRHGGGRSPVRSVRVPSPTRAADQGFGHRTTSTRSHGVAEVLEEIRSAHDAGRVIRASELLQLHSVVAELPAAQLLEAGIDVQQIECEAEAVSEALQSLENSDGWHVTRDDDLQTWYRHERGTSVHSLRFHTQLRHDVQSCLSLVREWDLITSWNHLALDPCVLDAPSTFLCYAYIAQVRHAAGAAAVRGVLCHSCRRWEIACAERRWGRAMRLPIVGRRHGCGAARMAGSLQHGTNAILCRPHAENAIPHAQLQRHNPSTGI